MEELRPLVIRARAGDLEAFGKIVRMFQDMACGYAYARLRDFHAAEDVAQEAFIQAYRDLGKLCEPAAFPGWFRRIVLTHCNRLTRRNQIPAVALSEAREVAASTPGPSEIAERAEIKEAVLEAIRSLPEDERTVTTLFYINGYSQQDIAEFLELPVTTVDGRLRISRKRLKERMVHMVEQTLKQNAPGEEFTRGVEKVLAGVEELGWFTGQECTFVGALTAAMRAIGEDVTYDYLMGVSGAAFRLLFRQSRPDNSSPDAVTVYDHSEPAMKALGYVADWDLVPKADRDNPEGIRNTRERIMHSIDKERPVVAMVRSGDWGLIVGYSDGGTAFHCRSYWDKTQGYSRAENWPRPRDWPWPNMVIGEKRHRPSRKASVTRSLQIAIELAKTSSFHTEQFGEHASGFAAYEIWAQTLLDESKRPDLNDCCNNYCYVSLVDAREAAAKYLGTIAGEFEEAATVHLRRAAELYDEITAELKSAREAVPLPAWLLKGKRPKPWTDEMQQTQARALQQSLEVEKLAIGELEKALVVLR